MIQIVIQPTKGKIKRCEICWPCSIHAQMDNGFIPESENFQHNFWCPDKEDQG